MLDGLKELIHELGEIAEKAYKLKVCALSLKLPHCEVGQHKHLGLLILGALLCVVSDKGVVARGRGSRVVLP